MNGRQIKQLLTDNGFNVWRARREGPRGWKTTIVLRAYDVPEHVRAHKLLSDVGVRNLVVTGLR